MSKCASLPAVYRLKLTASPVRSRRRGFRTALHFRRYSTLRPCFKHKIERRLAGAPESLEASTCNHVPNASLASLRAKTQPNLLREGCRRAEHGRRRIKDPAYQVQIVLDFIVGKRFDYHPRSITFQGAEYVSRGPDGISHVMQAIKKDHEIIVTPRVVLCLRYLE